MGKTVQPAFSTANLGDIYSKSLPQTVQTTAGGIGTFANAIEGAANATQGGYNQSNVDNLNKYGGALGNAASNALLEQITGKGGEAAAAGQALNEKLNPNYYSTLGAASNGAKSAIGAINLTGLSPGEEAATERSLNQTNAGGGNLGLNNGTNIVSNAMNFGGAFNNKVGLMNNAVSSATGVANAAAGNAGFNPVGMATNSSAPSSFIQSSPALAQPATSANTSLSNALMSMISQNNAAAITGNYANSSANSVPAYLNSMPSVSC